MKNKEGIDLEAKARRKIAEDAIKEIENLKEVARKLIYTAEANARIRDDLGRLENTVIIIAALLLTAGFVLTVYTVFTPGA